MTFIISKCIPVILYGLEACPLTNCDLQSMDSVINRFFMKLFKTSIMNILKYCQHCFSFDMPNDRGKSKPERLNVNSVNFVSVVS